MRRKKHQLSNNRSKAAAVPPEERLRQGYEAGYQKGTEKGRADFDSVFEGTSIIIPTFNQKDLLLQCLACIEAYTTQPYEIIIVDDGSSDGTKEALQRYRKVRLAVHEANKGFAGSVNTGLMMAKGRTVLLMNNDVLVTENWLSNLLDCLNSSPEIGAVGPVTNYIGGEQQIEVPYTGLEGMQEFAAAYNRQSPEGAGRWMQTDRLVGFCLLMTREVVERTGYFDEGYEVGNFEDDDWMLRLRLQGLKLMIAGNAFVHHIGSVSMKSLDPVRFEQINRRNEYFYQRKWGMAQDQGTIRQLLQLADRSTGSEGWSYAECLPVQAAARSSRGFYYWLDEGKRFRIAAPAGSEDKLNLTSVRLSQRELRRIPFGGEWTPEEAARAMERVSASRQNKLGHGSVVELPDGRLYQIDRGHRRPILTRHTTDLWGLSIRIQQALPEELEALPEGKPVLPPVLLLSDWL
ncbi:glycosyltransferase family 2 protein [Paenibacillus pinistramenti]|uniref:glycosyltransferase family 2 protein n=1 Tax=Paenibacillus pinistramenti TaxID=1768003 RepID=UPI0011095EE3|nr:glycosyltransferase family 2 protein [Paenibacillus pinistramenti]